jgi:hypothetical protein
MASIQPGRRFRKRHPVGVQGHSIRSISTASAPRRLRPAVVAPVVMGRRKTVDWLRSRQDPPDRLLGVAGSRFYSLTPPPSLRG